MLDDRNGIYPTASAALRQGEKFGIDRLFQATIAKLSHLSVNAEKISDVSAFRTAEQACAILREAKQELLNRNELEAIAPEGSS